MWICISFRNWTCKLQCTFYKRYQMNKLEVTWRFCVKLTLWPNPTIHANDSYLRSPLSVSATVRKWANQSHTEGTETVSSSLQRTASFVFKCLYSCANLAQQIRSIDETLIYQLTNWDLCLLSSMSHLRLGCLTFIYMAPLQKNWKIKSTIQNLNTTKKMLLLYLIHLNVGIIRAYLWYYSKNSTIMLWT
jgi:hypothetical protein